MNAQIYSVWVDYFFEAANLAVLVSNLLMLVGITYSVKKAYNA